MIGDGRKRGVIQLRPTGQERPEPAAARPLELTARTPRASVTGRGLLQVNLNWSVTTEADLDLGCLVRTRDGRGIAVQPLGESFGSFDGWPYVSLDQDDRTGAASDGETLRVNLERRKEFTGLLVYVTVYEGSVDFHELGGTVTVTAPGGTWRIRLDDSPSGAVACAVARLTPGAGSLDLHREVTWFTPHPEYTHQELIDRTYGFGFEWTPMSKPPL